MSATVQGRRDNRARTSARPAIVLATAGGDVGDHLGMGGEQAGELLQHAVGERGHECLRRRAHGGVELDAVGGDARGQLRQTLHLGRTIP